MAIARSRAEFKEYCLRKLGKPVIEINVDDDQVEDRIDEALLYFADYHFDATEKVFYKYAIQENDLSYRIKDVNIIDGGIGYMVGDAFTIDNQTGDPGLGGTVGHVSSVDNKGAITGIILDSNDGQYHLDPKPVSVTSDDGVGAKINAYRGGYIQLPDNIIGAVTLFPIGQGLNTNNLFNIRYQIALNDLYTLTSVSMVPYYMALTHIQQLEQLLVGQQPIRYNRHVNRLYIDTSWDIMNIGDFIIVEAYQVVDPDVFIKTWGDRWLARYASALIKQQWGQNLKKFQGMQLPGGLTFNGQQIYDEATEERKELEAEMTSSYSLPITDMIG